MIYLTHGAVKPTKTSKPREAKMEKVHIFRKDDKIEVHSDFLNRSFKGKYVDGILKAKPQDLKMIKKALELEAKGLI